MIIGCNEESKMENMETAMMSFVFGGIGALATVLILRLI
jgi:hypothetical protein